MWTEPYGGWFSHHVSFWAKCHEESSCTASTGGDVRYPLHLHMAEKRP